MDFACAGACAFSDEFPAGSLQKMRRNKKLVFWIHDRLTTFAREANVRSRTLEHRSDGMDRRSSGLSRQN